MRILFLCTQNACRSQMAEHWARHIAAENNLEGVFASAGTKPAVPNPRMLEVMAEVGVDCSTAKSQHLEEFTGQEWDLAITLCDSAAQNCPVFPSANKREHHPFPDPAHATGTDEEILNAFREVREQIRQWALSLLLTEND